MEAEIIPTAAKIAKKGTNLLSKAKGLVELVKQNLYTTELDNNNTRKI